MTELEINRLWTDDQPMSFMGLPIGRRTAVVKSEGDKLVVFSPLNVSPAVVSALRSVGEVVAFVVSSRFHDRFYDGYFKDFPKARFLASRAVMQDHRDWPLSEITPEAPELAGISFLQLDGMPWVQEQVFLHHASKSLIMADALFNVPLSSERITGLLMRAAGIGDGPKPCRLFRTLIQNRKAFAASLRKVLEWDFNRIIPGHGEVIERGAKSVLNDAYRRYLNEPRTR